MKQEKDILPKSGFLILGLNLLLVGSSIALIVSGMIVPAILLIVLFFFILPGFFINNPNESTVLVLFGEYKGSAKGNGFFWANPFMTKAKFSLRARNLDSQPIKVNDKMGNPIMIGIVLVWRVSDTFKAAFEVNNYEAFVKIQSEAAIRKLAGTYPYDNFDDEQEEISLRSGNNEVHEELMRELTERLSIAGIEVMEARISNLAYSQEIAGAMLQRQQATAIVAARTKIVEGAVGMVELALNALSQKNIIELDDDKKAAMVSNLMVVLCSDKSANPVINTGTLNQ
ncbi:MAG: SPFH domain-containing protein [Bacteroidia bacterium]|nr:SPFH domain-containing protein [Bacteroidia bacterium]MCF8426313.1 SPFH domain-containing protein [Bacteroidia bacterium]MCF8447076.1 SPFH domain-containing protein [Bacteroidia bacterium]